jgi:hypothetical protein
MVMAAADEQALYARWIEHGTRASLAMMVAGFVLYVAGWPAPKVPLQQLPELWQLPVAEYLRRTGMPAGLAWLRDPLHGDVIGLVGIELLALSSLPALAVAARRFAGRGLHLLAALCGLQIGVMALAASGWLVAGH